ncbi:lipopolysaccharide biosynthesis protein [Roseateles violae]|uniref:O-antigen/teichoic acid export membrane protein n=1 Tax=Roseateles violae TaxID=3058042 RepID=A0ABT8DR79_9BURK|nr:hypothetical protein [Pelomonas sp. PFR6]MDN3920478.1 hypothetical protein [Pelomonas sp. PFR6]
MSYCYLLIAGRRLAAAEFGVFNALLGVITIGGFLASSLQVAATQIVRQRLDRDTLRYLLRIGLRMALLGMLGFGIAGLLIGRHVQIEPLQIGLCALTLALMVFGSASTGALVGSGNVQSQASLACWGALARIGLGWPLMLLGLGVSAAIAGYAANYALIFVLAYLGCRRAASGDDERPVGHAPLRLDLRSMAVFVLGFAPFTLDQLLIQYLNPAVGGDYAAAATIAKLVFFASYPITALAYPRFLAKPPGPQRTRALAMAALAVLGTGGLLTLLIEAFAEPLIALFFGERFGGIAPQLRLLAPAALCFSLTALGLHAQIAWRAGAGLAAPLVALLLGLLLYLLRSSSLDLIVGNQMATLLLQLLLVWTLLWLSVLRPQRAAGRDAATP